MRNDEMMRNAADIQDKIFQCIVFWKRTVQLKMFFPRQRHRQRQRCWCGWTLRNRAKKPLSIYAMHCQWQFVTPLSLCNAYHDTRPYNKHNINPSWVNSHTSASGTNVKHDFIYSNLFNLHKVVNNAKIFLWLVTSGQVVFSMRDLFLGSFQIFLVTLC